MNIPSVTTVTDTFREYLWEAQHRVGKDFAICVSAAIKHLKEQGEKIESLETDLSKTRSEREYFRSRAVFFGEISGEANKIISVEGYKAFRGTMKIQPKTAAVPSFELSGDWLYKPETDCWYGKGSSFGADICTIVEDK